MHKLTFLSILVHSIGYFGYSQINNNRLNMFESLKVRRDASRDWERFLELKMLCCSMKMNNCTSSNVN